MGASARAVRYAHTTPPGDIHHHAYIPYITARGWVRRRYQDALKPSVLSVLTAEDEVNHACHRDTPCTLW